MDAKLRITVKTLSWRLTGTFCKFGISLFVLDDISTSSTIAPIQIIFNTIIFYFHERIWNIIQWGKQNNYYNL